MLRKQTTQNNHAVDNNQQTKPKADDIERKKARFIEHLKKNGGSVSAALEDAALARKTAYEHLRNDITFSAQWDEALEIAREKLIAEAVRRGVKGDVRYITVNGKRKAVYSKSDKLLQFLIERNDKRCVKKRIILVGNTALEAIREDGRTLGLTEEQVTGLQNALIERFKKISLN